MKIKRKGSDRDHGLVATTATLRGTTWKPVDQTVELTSWYVPDFNTASRHDWFISVTPAEVAAMVDAVASGINGPDRELIASAFAPSISSLLRIATESSLKLQPAPPPQAIDPEVPAGDQAESGTANGPWPTFPAQSA